MRQWVKKECEMQYRETPGGLTGGDGKAMYYLRSSEKPGKEVKTPGLFFQEGGQKRKAQWNESVYKVKPITWSSLFSIQSLSVFCWKLYENAVCGTIYLLVIHNLGL